MPKLLDRKEGNRESENYRIKIPLLTVWVFKENNKFWAKCAYLDLITEMDTHDEVLKAMVEMIKEYAQDYEAQKEIFSKSPNRYHHLPYIERINECRSDWELLEQIEVRYGHIHI